MPFAHIRSHHVFQFVNSHRGPFYGLVSLLAVWAVITNALKNYSNFYAVAVFLSKSSRSVVVLANFGILLALLCGHVFQRIFFGVLRPIEVERLYDRLWFFITESLLAFTIFRDEVDTPFDLMFGFLLFVKSFHWLASDRIEWMDQRPYPGPPLMFHFRMNILFALLLTTDLLMFFFTVEHTLSVGVGGMVLFASEYAVLSASMTNTILKYGLSVYDLRRAGRLGGENAPPWENKSMWIFYIELVTDFFKLSTYLVFFCVIIAFYGLPLNIVRDVYVTARSFITRLKALRRYQTATRNMDQRYPNATEEELVAMNDRTCIICREEMVSPAAQESNGRLDGPNMTPKKLPCGHIFHFHCLRSWLERQQNCPTCRRSVLDEGTDTRAVAAGGQRQNALPDRPQENVLGPQAQVNAQNANNPLGFLGRLFGPANRLPNAADRQAVQNNQGQQPGIFINYQVQYRFPERRNEGNLQVQQQQQLPPYPGFQGPGGAWQPWPGEGAAQPQTTLPPTTTENSRTDRLTSESQVDTPSPTQGSLESSNGAALPAREAARQAALRRFGSQQEIKDNPNESAPTTSTSNVVDPPPQESAPTNDMSIGSSPPELIPLFNFDLHAQNSFVPPPSVLQSATLPITPETGPNHLSTGDLGSSTTSGDPSATLLLPQSLTEEQLARLDMLTRESIDERLRILENVSATIHRCVDDLLRLRSALPLDLPSTTGASGSPSPSSTISAEDKDRATQSNKGKEKEKVEDVPISELPEAQSVQLNE